MEGGGGIQARTLTFGRVNVGQRDEEPAEGVQHP